MDSQFIKNIIEGALIAAGRPLTLDNLLALFKENEVPERDLVKSLLKTLEEEMQDRSIELKKVSSGYRLQVRSKYAPWISRLWEDKPPRYSRAFMETLALIVYRQPITRGEIESIRGVSVSSSIIRSLMELEWIKAVGHRDVPGKPALFGTTKKFLDSFNLTSLDDLPSLADLRSLDDINNELGFDKRQEAKQENSPGTTAELPLTESEEKLQNAISEAAGDQGANVGVAGMESEQINSDNAASQQNTEASKSLDVDQSDEQSTDSTVENATNEKNKLAQSSTQSENNLSDEKDLKSKTNTNAS